MKYSIKLLLYVITMLILSACISSREVLRNYHRGGVKPAGRSELKHRHIKTSFTN